MKKYPIIIVVISLAMVSLLVFFWLKNDKTQSQENSNQPSVVAGVLPSGTQFDASADVTGTNVKVEYPKSGFYGHGAVIGQGSDSASIYELKGGVAVRTENFDANKPLEYPDLLVNVYKIGSEKTLESIVARVTRDQIPDLANAGSYQTINGHRYFVYLNPEGSSYQVFTLDKNEIIKVVLSGGFDGKDRNNLPDILRQILSHIEF